MGIQEEFSKRKAQEESEYIITERRLLTRLTAIMNRLYDDKPLDGDSRRDLANELNALIAGGSIEIIPYTGE